MNERVCVLWCVCVTWKKYRAETVEAAADFLEGGSERLEKMEMEGHKKRFCAVQLVYLQLFRSISTWPIKLA